MIGGVVIYTASGVLQPAERNAQPDLSSEYSTGLKQAGTDFRASLSKSLSTTKSSNPQAVLDTAARSFLDGWGVRAQSNQAFDIDEFRSGLSALGKYDKSTADAIRDFLLLTDPFDDRLVELRRALIEYALEHEQAEWEEFAFKLLRDGTNVYEISVLGRFLEAQQPGVYTEFVRQLAEDHLLLLSHSDPLPGDFFQLLGEVGDETTALLLEDVPIQFNVYATVSSALLQDGSGIVLLQQIARPTVSHQTTFMGRVALELLAQQAAAQPEAASALIDLAADESIPGDLWAQLADYVSGKSYITLTDPHGLSSGNTTIYRQEGNQILYRAQRTRLIEGLDAVERRLLLLEALRQLAPDSRANVFTVAGEWLTVNWVEPVIASAPTQSSQHGFGQSVTGD